MSVSATSANIILGSHLQSRIENAFALAQEYVQIAADAESAFKRMDKKQDSVLAALSISNTQTYASKFYSSDGYTSRSLDIDGYRENLYTSVINKVVWAINESLSTTFGVSEHEVLENFSKNGINVDFLYEKLEIYMAGRSASDVAYDETLTSFNSISKSLTTGVVMSFSDYASLSINKKVVTISDFVDADNWNGTLSYRSKGNLDLLVRYLKVILNDGVTFGSAPMVVDFGLNYVPDTGLKSMVKQVSVFKNGNIKIAFHNEADVAKFIAPLVKLNGLTADSE